MAATLALIVPSEIKVQITLDFLDGMNYMELVEKYSLSKYYVVQSVTQTLRAAHECIGDSEYLNGRKWKKSSTVARKDKAIWQAAISQLTPVSVS